MKVINLLFFLSLIHPALQACPTCIGRLDKNTPPFFSAEYESAHAYPIPIFQETGENLVDAELDVEEEA